MDKKNVTYYVKIDGELKKIPAPKDHTGYAVLAIVGWLSFITLVIAGTQ